MCRPIDEAFPCELAAVRASSCFFKISCHAFLLSLDVALAVSSIDTIGGKDSIPEYTMLSDGANNNKKPSNILSDS